MQDCNIVHAFMEVLLTFQSGWTSCSILASRPALGLTQLPTQWVPRAPSLGAKWPGREAELLTRR